MKFLILILLFSSTSLFAQSFEYTDTIFEVGQVKIAVPIIPEICYNLWGNDRDSLLIFMKQNPELILELRNYSDTRGSEKYNFALTQRRSEVIATYLIKNGIDTLRIIPKGLGELNPIISKEEIDKMETQEEKEKAHQTNRRIEIEIVGIKP